MSSASPPIPLSTSSPQREPLPAPAAEPLGETPNATATVHQPTSTVPFESYKKLVGRKMCEMAAFMRSRPAEASLVRVIAVDGPDRNAVHGMIANLHHYITRDLRYVVRVISEDSFYPPVNQPTQLSHFIRHVQSWRAIWDMILYAIPPDPTPHYGRVPPGLTHPAYPLATFESPLVYLLPLSPLMATMQAIRYVVDLNDPWRLLSGYWRDSFKPDITINIQHIPDTHYRNEVLRFQLHGTKALIVSKEEDAGWDITPKQMRRVVFEVEEWIRW